MDGDDTQNNEPHEILTWQTFGDATRVLSQQIAESGYRPDTILTIARGGLLAASAIAYGLNVKNIAVINVEYYTGVNERLDFPVVLPQPLDGLDLSTSRMLIVDDVNDTGSTLNAVHEYLKGRVAETRTAVIYEKPRSAIRCEYVWKATDRWIDFPWSDKPPFLDREGNLASDATVGH